MIGQKGHGFLLRMLTSPLGALLSGQFLSAFVDNMLQKDPGK